MPTALSNEKNYNKENENNNEIAKNEQKTPLTALEKNQQFIED